MTYTLRPYQTQAVNAIYDYFRKKTGNPIISVVTGGGKSLICAEFIRSAITNYPSTRIIVATTSKEIVEQDYKELHTLCPEIRAGIYSAGIGRRDTRFPITFAGIQSCYKRAVDFGEISILICDECHTISRDAATRWQTFIAGLKIANPYLKVIGMSATPFRLDSGSLVKGEGALFDDIIFEYGVLEAVKDGYLVAPIPRQMETQLDVRNVHKRGGEFIAGELERAVDKAQITEAAVREIVRHGQIRESWIVFCTGVKHTNHVAEAIREHGVECAVVTGETPRKEREHIIKEFKARRLRAICNANVLTVGFDAPCVDLVAMLRPTASAGLYCQIVGRGLRLFPGKKDCLVLDHSGNTARHGPVDQVKVKEPGKGDGEAPIRICEQCSCICHAAARHCPDCGMEFPRDETPKITTQAADEALLSTQIAPRRLEVSEVLYYRHDKPGGTPSLKVDYRCGISRHSEWICVQHSGHAREKAAVWWSKRGGGVAPRDVDAALTAAPSLKQPKAIFLTKDGKWNRVSGYEF